jgi:DNA primase
MNAVDFINENLNPRKILDFYHFREITETDEQIRCCCEIHKGNNPSAFVWNKSNNLWYCYTGDCHGGDVYTLVEKMDGVDFPTAVKRTADILNIDIASMVIKKQTDKVKADTLKWLQFMKMKNHSISTLLSLPDYQLPYTKYADSDERFTRFDEDVLSFYKAKFCNVYPTEEKLLYNKLVIPLYFQDVLYGVALRTLDDGKPKWVYQPRHLPIREMLYNYDVAMQTIKENKLTEIILVEGFFDVWAYHRIGIDNVVSIYGSSLKKEQEKLILKMGVDTVILSFDNDEAGIKCTNDILTRFRNKFDLKQISLPDTCDPADMKPEDLLQCYLKRQ